MRSRLLRSARLAAPLSLAALGEAAAQPSTRTDSAVALPGVVVTATRTAATALAAPLAVSRVGTAELRAVNGYGLADALSRVPGVVAQTRYGTSDVRLVIRGFGARGAGDRSNAGTSRGVRVLLDGIPETEPDGRTAFDHVDLAAAEEVEVIRSNASALWGNAAGGVVNVRTVPDADSPRLEAQPIIGGFGLRRFALRGARPLGGGTAFAQFTNSTFDGWRAHSSARRALLNAGAVATVGERTRVGVHATGANNLMHIPGPLTQAQMDADPRQANATYLARDERRLNRTARLGATVDHTVNENTAVAAMLYVNPKYLQRSERGTYRDFTRYHLGGSASVRNDFRVGATRGRFLVGAEEAYQDGAILFYTLTPEGTRGTTLNDNKGEGANNLGVFAQQELVVADRLTLVAGARWDRLSYYYNSFLPNPPVRHDSRDFSRVTPKLGASWLLSPRASVYANVGGGVEIPAGNETDPVPGQPPALLNPLLDPIRSTTYEAGFKGLGMDAGLRVGFDVALYHTEVANEIIPYNGGRFYQTAGRARRSGAELGLDVTTTAGIFGDVALTASRNRYAHYVVDSTLLGRPGVTADYSGNAIVGVPSVIANARIGAELPFARALRVSAGVEHLGRYWADDANTVNVPAYAIFNLTAELRRPIVATDGWGVRGFVTLHNLADRRYVGAAFLNPDRIGGAPAAYEPGMPRSVLVSLTVGRM